MYTFAQNIENRKDENPLYYGIYLSLQSTKNPIIQYFYWYNGKSNNLYRVYTTTTSSIHMVIHKYIHDSRKVHYQHSFLQATCEYGNGSCYRSTTIHYSQRVIILGYI